MLGLLNRIFKIPLFLTLAASPLIFGVPQTIELSDAFSSALRNSETFLGKQEEINQAEEKYRQALGAVLPTVTAFASYQWQAAAGGGAFSPTEQPVSY
ncbi:MAG: hypothetical protein EB078_06840, partial [Proteobacteria bacterium]|nr:hypothetical protein [Pseudomonadota bacterium]NDD04604.1 hypothetical protein [Pseudomonadota bacterium]